MWDVCDFFATDRKWMVTIIEAFIRGSSDVFVIIVVICVQLAFCTGEHQMAAASVPTAEGSASGCPRCGPGPPTGPGALF